MTHHVMQGDDLPRDTPDGSAKGEREQASLMIFESAEGSHWREFSDDPRRARGWSAAGRTAGAVALLPLALLTMIVTLAALPVLALFDRRRGDDS